MNLLTLHSTKGLEFSRVYVVGVEDAQFPGGLPGPRRRSPEVEEARRLLYVGMTRAKDRLVLSRAAVRRGNRRAGIVSSMRWGWRPLRSEWWSDRPHEAAVGAAEQRQDRDWELAAG